MSAYSFLKYILDKPATWFTDGKTLSTFVAVLVKVWSGTDFMQMVKHMATQNYIQLVEYFRFTFSFTGFYNLNHYLF